VWLVLVIVLAGAAAAVVFTQIQGNADGPPQGDVGDSGGRADAAATLAETPHPPVIGETPPGCSVREADGMPVCRIPGGPFGLGLSDEELSRHRAACVASGASDCESDEPFRRERPEIWVQLSDFAMDAYEVTRSQYRQCVLAGACAPIEESACALFNGENWRTRADDPTRALPDLAQLGDSPQVCVTRGEAQAYCAWVGAALPSEAQWERAAAGTEGRVYPWGDRLDSRRATYAGATRAELLPMSLVLDGQTPEGLHHLSGNAYEWMADDACAYADFPTHPDPVCVVGGDGVQGVVRGGSFASRPSSLRSTWRRFAEITVRVDNYGFRCASF
jgi:formylglycine-generating enzyme required for sulfatase activity